MAERLDKFLWHARFFKTRVIAAEIAASGRVRVNGQMVEKPGYGLKLGDVLTFPQGELVRVVKIVAVAERRGPASEAQKLYEDLDPPPPRTARTPEPPPISEREKRAGRPTKKDRRDLEKWRDDI
jgi:ribosome-associated heat shock protein Hsp15